MKRLGVEGVGKTSQSTTTGITMPIAMLADSGQAVCGEYYAPVVGTDAEPSDIPALLGLKSLKKYRSILDMINDKLYLIGPGDPQITLPPGSICLSLEQSPSGHLLIPCTEYRKATANGKNVAFPVVPDTHE
eukprot:9369483-Karenia_brevis.AAC.1